MKLFSNGDKFRGVWLTEAQRELTAALVNKCLMGNYFYPNKFCR